MPILEVKNVTKRFRRKKEKFYALNDVSLSVEEGEIFAILGPNGAGKTTLLNIVLGMLYPDEGAVFIRGVNNKDRKSLLSLGYVSGEERFHWALTPRDILRFGAKMHSLKDQNKKVEELMDLFGLQKVAESGFGVLSTGEKMRLAFAYALLGSPKILLLDEPTLGLDPDIAVVIRKEIKRINKELKTTIVLTSHYMAEVEELANRVAFINKGRIVDQGTVTSIRKKHPNLESYFLSMAKQDESVAQARLA